MIRLRLFSSTNSSQQIDQRMIGEDAVTIGRDASADWVVADPNRALSRRHCTVRASGGGIGVRDTSANGTFIGDEAQAIGADREEVVQPGGSIRLGTFVLTVEVVADLATPPPSPPAVDPLLFAPPPGLKPAAGPSTPARRDPFASQLAPDPLLAEHRPTDRVALGDGDAWEFRPSTRAGDWDLPRQKPDHDQLIGTPRNWSEPKRAESDAGFGFDAPFERPIVAPTAPAQGDAIPADWADPVQAAEPELSLPDELPPAVASPPVVETRSDEPPIPPEPPVSKSAKPARIRNKAVPSEVPAAGTVAPPPDAPVPAPPPALSPPTAPAIGSAADDLFAAFCAGARLSPTAFGSDDRAPMMARLGEVYRAMIVGLAEVIGERNALKNEYRMSRTLVQPEHNNPFKWVPPQRLAVEVIRGGDGFTSGAEAVIDSFGDLKAHLVCVLAGMRAAIAATATALSPAIIENAAEGRSYLIKAQRDAALWTDYVARFDRFQADGEDADSAVNRAFRLAYERQMADLAASAGGDAASSREPR